MSLFASLIGELVALAAVVSGIQFAVLAFRNPLRAAWLRTSLAESVTVVTIVGALTLTVALVISGLVALGTNIFVAIAGGLLLPIAIGYANDRLFSLRARLKLCDAGRSPFLLPTGTANPAGSGKA